MLNSLYHPGHGPLPQFPPLGEPECPKTVLGITEPIELKSGVWKSIPWVEDFSTSLCLQLERKGLQSSQRKMFTLTFEADITCDNVADIVRWRLAGYKDRKIVYYAPNSRTVRHADIGYTRRDKKLIASWTFACDFGFDGINYVPQISAVLKNKDKSCTINDIVLTIYG